MIVNTTKHNRKSIRLKGFDYSSAGAYFVTVCTQDRLCLFGEIADENMILNDVGQMIHAQWLEMAKRFEIIALDQSVVMPNHVHGILFLKCRGESCIRPDDKPKTSIQGEHEVRPYGTLDDSLGRILQAFKSITTNAYIRDGKQRDWPSFPGKLWQRNYFERVIRNEKELNRIRDYIINNPLKWHEDKNNPSNW